MTPMTCTHPHRYTRPVSEGGSEWACTACGERLGTVWFDKPEIITTIDVSPERIERLQARIAELEAALRDVREEICKGPVSDVLWHREIPAETTVDFITNTLADDWSYDDWSARAALQEGRRDG